MQLRLGQSTTEAHQGLATPSDSEGEAVGLRKQTVVDSPEFKRWFGHSSCVDEQGDPRVVYHGTDNVFDVFAAGVESSRFCLFSEFKTVSNGFFFAGSQSTAETFGERVLAVYLSIQNPLRSPDELFTGSRMPEADRLKAMQALEDCNYILGAAMYEDGGARYIDTDNGVSRTSVDADGAWLEKVFKDGLLDWDLLDKPEVVQRMVERGYDGVKVLERETEEGFSWFVVDPRQIKSATENCGNFDASNPGFRE